MTRVESGGARSQLPGSTGSWGDRGQTPLAERRASFHRRSELRPPPLSLWPDMRSSRNRRLQTSRFIRLWRGRETDRRVFPLLVSTPVVRAVPQTRASRRVRIFPGAPSAPRERWNLRNTDGSQLVRSVSFRDLTATHKRMRKLGVEIVQPISRDAEYGFRHFFVRAPNGVLVELVEAPSWPAAARENAH